MQSPFYFFRDLVQFIDNPDVTDSLNGYFVLFTAKPYLKPTDIVCNVVSLLSNCNS